jgi:hypothetical protein
MTATHSRTTLLALLVFAAAFALRLGVVLTPIPFQLDRALPDDAYYYFLTAQNIAASGSPSVDGMHPSNGWHPLWMIVSTVIFSGRYSDPDMPVRLVIGLGALCDSLAAAVLFLGLWRIGVVPALIAGLFYAFNTMPMLQAVNGLETGLAALMLALAWLTTLRVSEQPSAGRAAVWGLVFGLAFLARTDTALVLVPLGLYALWRLRARVGLVVVGAAVSLVAISPWLLWNQANFGTPLEQVSGSAVPWAARARVEAVNPDVSTLAYGIDVLLGSAYWIRGDYLGAPPLIGFFLWIPGLVGLIDGLRRPDRRQVALIGLALLLGGVLLLLVHTVVRWYPRPWYFVVVAQSLAFGLALFWSFAKTPLIRLAVLAIGAVGMGVGGYYAFAIGYYPWQSGHQYAAALWARENTPPDAMLASMNSGIIGYYSGRITVNMDGVVNPSAFEAIQERRMLAYMRETGVDYFIDSDNAVEREYSMFMGDGYPDGLREIAVISEVYPGLGEIRAYQVVRDE